MGQTEKSTRDKKFFKKEVIKQSGKCCGGCFLNNDSTGFYPQWCLWVLKAKRCIAHKDFRMGAVRLLWDKLTVNTACTDSGSRDYVLSFDRRPHVLMDAKTPYRHNRILKALKHDVLRH